MTTHRWSGWPGAWCLDCGIEDPLELALANDDIVWNDDGTEYTIPSINIPPCRCPGYNDFNPYIKKDD